MKLTIVFTRKTKLTKPIAKQTHYCKPIDNRSFGILYRETSYGWCYPDEIKRIWDWHKILVVCIPF
jgi:hypothetical protein